MRRFVHFVDNSKRKAALALTLGAALCGLLSFVAPKSVSISEDSRAGRQKKPEKDRCKRGCSGPSEQTIYIPLIDLPEARGGELVFNSRSAEPLDVTPVFYKRNGETVIGDPVQIQSAEIRYVKIEDLLPKRHRNEKNWGGFALSYQGGNRQMWSQFRFLGVNGGGNVDEFFTVKAESRSPLYEAAWWVPDKSESIIALGNITESATSATVTFSDGHARTVSLPPHATEVVRQKHRNSGTESVKVEVTGAAGSVVPTGVITARDGSFNSVIRFYSPSLTRQPHLFANGFRVAGMNPHMILKNTTSSSITVQTEFLPGSGRANADTLILPPINLGPNALTEVDLTPLKRAAMFGNVMDTVSVQVANNGAPGSVIGSIYGIDETTGLSYDVPLRDSGGPRTMTGSYPWKITDDFSTIVHVTNITDQEAQFITQINYPGGNLIFEPRKVGPGETAVFDLKKIRDDGVKDLAGKQLPANVSQGQFKWAVRGMTNGKLVLIGRAEMVSRSRGISTSYSCNDPCPPYYEGSIDPFMPPIVINGSAATAVWETAYYDTGYTYYTVGPYATSAGWTPLYNPTVVTFDPSNGHSITVTGMEEGGTTLHGFIAMQQDYGWDGLNCYEYGYYEEYADAPVEVAPAVNYKTASIPGSQDTFEVFGSNQTADLTATASQCNPQSNFVLTVTFWLPQETREVFEVTMEGFGNTSVSEWNVDQGSVSHSTNLSVTPRRGDVIGTVNNKNGGQTGTIYNAIQINVKGKYNSGQTFSTLGTVRINCP